jgi:hypothetical protein
MPPDHVAIKAAHLFQEMKYSFDYEAPPTYFDAILISRDDHVDEV